MSNVTQIGAGTSPLPVPSSAPTVAEGTINGHSLLKTSPSPQPDVREQAIPSREGVSVAAVDQTEDLLSFDHLDKKVNQWRGPGLAKDGTLEDFSTFYSWHTALQCMSATQKEGAFYAVPFNSDKAILVSKSPLWKEPANLFVEGALCYEKKDTDAGNAFKNAGKAKIREINNTLSSAEFNRIADNLPATSDLYAEAGKHYKMSAEHITGHSVLQKKIASCLEQAAEKLEKDDTPSGNRYLEAAICFKRALTTASEQENKQQSFYWNYAGAAMQNAALRLATSEEATLYSMASHSFQIAATTTGSEQVEAIANATSCLKAAEIADPIKRNKIVASINNPSNTASTSQRPTLSGMFYKIFG